MKQFLDRWWVTLTLCGLAMIIWPNHWDPLRYLSGALIGFSSTAQQLWNRATTAEKWPMSIIDEAMVKMGARLEEIVKNVAGASVEAARAQPEATEDEIVAEIVSEFRKQWEQP